jgi:hypothetical protein
LTVKAAARAVIPTALIPKIITNPTATNLSEVSMLRKQIADLNLQLNALQAILNKSPPTCSVDSPSTATAKPGNSAKLSSAKPAADNIRTSSSTKRVRTALDRDESSHATSANQSPQMRHNVPETIPANKSKQAEQTADITQMRSAISDLQSSMTAVMSTVSSLSSCIADITLYIKSTVATAASSVNPTK